MIKMACCRYNRTGTCKGCACAKADKPCTGCLPGKLGTCVNQKRTPAVPTNTVTTAPDPTHPSARDLKPLTSHQNTEDGGTGAQDVLQTPLIPTLSQTTSCLTLDLPDYTSRSPSVFTWGECTATEFSTKLEEAYKTVIHWRKNCFTPPSGRAGKGFVSELSRLYQAFGTASTLESVALKATIVLPHLLLQKPHRTSKNKDHIACLDRRLSLWKKGDIDQLMEAHGNTNGIVHCLILEPSTFQLSL